MIVLSSVGILVLCLSTTFGFITDLEKSQHDSLRTQSHYCLKVVSGKETRSESFTTTCTGFVLFSFGTRTCTQYRAVTVTVTRQIQVCCKGYAGDECQYPLTCNVLKIADSGLDDIVSIDVTATNPTPELTGLGTLLGGTNSLTPRSACFDYIRNLCIWSDQTSELLYIVNLTDLTTKALFSTRRDAPDPTQSTSVEGMDLDPFEHKLFYTDDSQETVSTIDYLNPGPNATIIVDRLSSGFRNDEPRGIRLDVHNKHVYFCNADRGERGFIARMNYDGSNFTILVHANSSALDDPNYIALDLDGFVLYWTEEQTQQVGRINLDGTDFMHIAELHGQVARLSGIHLFGDYLFVANFIGSHLLSVKKTGGNLTNFGNPGFDSPQGIYPLCQADTREAHYCCCPGYSGVHCTIQCPGGRVWNPCGSQCERTCADQNPCGGTCGSVTATCAQNCTAGCVCPDGHVFHEGMCQSNYVCPRGVVTSREETPAIPDRHDCQNNNPCDSKSGKFAHHNFAHYIECVNGTCETHTCLGDKLWIQRDQRCRGPMDFF